MITYGFRIIEEFMGQRCPIAPVFRNYDDAEREIFKTIEEIGSAEYSAYILHERYEEVLDDNGFIVESTYTKTRYKDRYYVNDNGKVKCLLFSDSHNRPQIELHDIHKRK